jgi:hypothetical protein
MKTKQTAVDWLESEFIKLEQTIGVHGIMYELIEQAKEIGREQIADDFYSGYEDWDELFVEFENNKQCTEHILVFKNFLKKNYHPPVKMVESDESPYCPICTGCGEEGCCSPLNCTQDPNGHYCQTYLRDLKFGYKMYDEISKLLNEDPKYKDDVDVIFNKVYNEIYRVK